MATLVQGYPQQSTTTTMLQTRPTSASGMLQASQPQQSGQYGNNSQKRHSIHGLPGGAAVPIAYRAAAAPIQPYAFTSTPSLNQGTPWQQFGSSRTNSAPSVPTTQTFDQNQYIAARPRYSASASLTNLPSSATVTSQNAFASRDDSVLPGPGSRRPPMPRLSQSSQSSGTSSQSSQTSQSSVGSAPSKLSPERYRRTAMRSPDQASSGQATGRTPAPPSGTSMTAVGQNYTTRNPLDQRGAVPRSVQNRPNSAIGPLTGSAVDDMPLSRPPQQDDVKRFRRRSMPALDSVGPFQPLAPQDVKRELKLSEQSTRPKSADTDQIARKNGGNLSVDGNANLADSRTASSDSRSSARSSGSTTTPSGNPPSPSQRSPAGAGPDYPRLVNIPPRSSSSDAASTKRMANPSPLSKPVDMDKEVENGGPAAVPASPVKPASPGVESPAVRQLSAIRQGGGKAKSKTSRLRRAFSFGSAAEFRKAGQENDTTDNPRPTTPGKLHKDRDPEEAYNAEQARIAQQQEDAGIGSNIYGGKLFTGSTDNLSISSTASSASIMIRKMGRGMKKGTRSLVGLFRPKSVIGAPAADAKLPETPEASVSMVTAEAERERVNVNADPHSQPGGGTGFPHLERNSIDAANAPSLSERLGSSGTDNSTSRRSIVGGERERAEVLAAVRKGILKNTSGSSTPSPKPSETRPSAFDVPGVPSITDSPNSSAPSTPNDEVHGHKRGGTVTIGSEDYFVSALRLRQDTKSAPGTPQGTMKRNATFSPRIIFYDTWPSQEYDRRGEIATCNRLTPMLAQQIKEELNSFKMEMEVHENSKIYTHFF
ncbi:hypothetical protein QBC47DRAFT_405775 [Echria macrotheca]|uniref:Protein BNI4 n=1 Tax=Echria macrotheca TaxID=438768 RepID=A0AAJ0B4X7_9PEZI|nr:hypothetical protein QBC47DRAFT_405775 [Echria macrotheca]